MGLISPSLLKSIFLPFTLADSRRFHPMSQPQAPTQRTRVIREHERGVYDRETAYKILD